MVVMVTTLTTMVVVVVVRMTMMMKASPLAKSISPARQEYQSIAPKSHLIKWAIIEYFKYPGVEFHILCMLHLGSFYLIVYVLRKFVY